MERVIEGTWEEVARRGPELAGHRVRLTVLDDLTVREPSGTQGEETAFDVLSRAGLIGCLKGGPDAPKDLASNPAHMEGFGE